MHFQVEDTAVATLASSAAHSWGTLIACLFRGSSTPPHCEAMLRDPLPDRGCTLGPGFADAVLQALRVNPAVHDGAMMLRLLPQTGRYVLCGWSYRLFPPSGARTSIVNRGSAFNSCISMSLVERVDCLYLVSNGSVTKFRNGEHDQPTMC